MVADSTQGRIQEIRLAAEKDNPAAQYILQKLPFIGSWNVQRMEDDYLLGRLEPPTTDPLDDPYFTIPYELETALEGHTFTSRDSLQWIENVFAESWEIFEHSSTPERPTFTKTSLQIYFSSCAEDHLFAFQFAFIIHLLGLSLLPLQATNSGEWFAVLVVTGLIILVVTLPAGLMTWFIKHFGMSEGLPLCSCKTMHKGVQQRIKYLDEDHQIKIKDSIHNNPWYIRRSLSIFKAYFWFIPLLSLPSLLLASVFFQDRNNRSGLLLPFIGAIPFVPFVFFWLFCSFHALTFIFGLEFFSRFH